MICKLKTVGIMTAKFIEIKYTKETILCQYA